ncbi:hypothetical protein Pth03_10030 [Planotetraspora thailandica]|uniref:Ig-like domain-containing protein n=1 Tax=Planotetraspora thailandica TaxID=487172 RepID=A0A8J3UV84_9ACTN|nr:RCC1 domain-containing protein [Planotetraspora thailandica]GII52614.1 hypothetical protein Pth03_10030 [Planotetraspora thailandica]
MAAGAALAVTAAAVAALGPAGPAAASSGISQVYAWGVGGSGRLGNDSTADQSSPVAVSALSQVAQVSAGYIHSLALRSDGTVWTWGDNRYGQLGNGTTTASSVPVPVPGLTGVVQVAAGGHDYRSYSLALRSDGTVWAWGDNALGEFGDGTTIGRTTPVQVPGLTGVTQIAAGSYHNLALRSDGTVVAWGMNGNGQLGDGTTALYRNRPMVVSGLTRVTQIAAGYNYSLALRSDGTVMAWGYNFNGELGDGTTTYRHTPVQVAGLTGVTQIAAGTYHSLALRSDGTVMAWGYNYRGRLGDGTTIDRHAPVTVSGLSDVALVSTGATNGVAVRSDGTVAAWGDNLHGQLGDGTTGSYRATPATVPGLSSVTQISAGAVHTLAKVGPPELTANAAITGDVGTTLTCQAPFVGATSVSYTWLWDGAAIPDATTATYTPPSWDAGHQATCQVTAANDLGTTDASATITIAPADLSAETAPIAEAGKYYSYRFAATGYPTPKIALVSGALPPGLALDTDGTLYGTPSQGGTYRFSLSATNGIGAVAGEEKTVVVQASATFTAGTAPIAVAGKPYKYRFAAAGYPTPKITRVSGTLPPGLALAADGTLSGTPTRGGSYKFTLSASNGVGTAATAAETVVVQAPARFTGGTSPIAVVGKKYSYRFAATGYPTPKITRVSGTLPPGLKLAANGTLSGTPTRAGSYRFALSATNGVGTAAKITKTVIVRAPAHFTRGTPPIAHVGKKYSYRFAATGYPTPKITRVSGKLPAGLKLATNGILSGKPTRRGTYKFTLAATNGVGTAAKITRTVVVR